MCEYTYTFDNIKKRILPHNIGGEMLVKAAKPKNVFEKLGLNYQDFREGRISNKVELPLAIDATAGLGEDALLLAASGFRVIMFERDEKIAELLEKTLEANREDDEIGDIISRMTLYKQDSIEVLPTLDVHPTVILLDPMFPERKKTGLVKKKFQMIHTLEAPCSDEAELFDAALSCGADKIIVKRPAKGPFLSGKTPSYSIKGNVIRYDVYC